MKWKDTLFWFGLFAICSLSFGVVQDTIRPNYRGENQLVWYLLGVAPNFFPAVGIPGLFLLIMDAVFKEQKPAWYPKRHLIAMGISFAGLTLWEIAQIATPKGVFDWHDVNWTVLGTGLFYAIWRFYTRAGRRS